MKQNNNYGRKNIDRCALLEEIEKNKIDEIKMKTLKNVDKYSKQNKAAALHNSTLTTPMPGSSQLNYRRLVGNPNATPAPIARESRLQAVFNSTTGSQGD